MTAAVVIIACAALIMSGVAMAQGHRNYVAREEVEERLVEVAEIVALHQVAIDAHQAQLVQARHHAEHHVHHCPEHDCTEQPRVLVCGILGRPIQGGEA